jgi:hypothetical protein
VDWTVELCQDDVLVATTQSGSDGSYEFTGLAAGTYVVKESVQDGWATTTPTEVEVEITATQYVDLDDMDIPQEPVLIKLQWPGYTTDTYFTATITEFDGTPYGVFEDWCIDLGHVIYTNSWYAANMISSLTEDTMELPSWIDKPWNLPLVNYVLNQDYSAAFNGAIDWRDIQGAIWRLIDSQVGPDRVSGGSISWHDNHADYIVADALANGQDFLPGCENDVVGVILEPIVRYPSGAIPTSPPDGDMGVIAQVQVAQIQLFELGVECQFLYSAEDVHFGAYPLETTISGYKYNDANMNGQWDEGEEGLAGWTVNLLDEEGNIVATTVTGEDGSYVFTDAPTGTYTVEEVQQTGWMATGPTSFDVPLTFTTTSADPAAVYSYTLWAGQYMDVGDLLVTFDGTDLYVTYSLDEDYYLLETQLFVGTGTPSANPGSYDFKDEFDEPYPTSKTYVIGLDDLSLTEWPETLNIAAHATVGSDLWSVPVDHAIEFHSQTGTYISANSANTALGGLPGNAVESWEHSAWTKANEPFSTLWGWSEADWIWSSWYILPAEGDGSWVTFQETFEIDSAADLEAVTGSIQIQADNLYLMTLNGEVVGHSVHYYDEADTHEWADVNTHSFDGLFVHGENVVEITGKNIAGSTNPTSNPAGVIYQGNVAYTTSGGGCEPTPTVVDFTQFAPGASVEELGTVLPDLNIQADGTAIAIFEGITPGAYGAPNGGGSVTNGGTGPLGGFSDTSHVSSRTAHYYEFTFTEGKPVSDFSLRMLDYGDWNPSANTHHIVTMTAYDGDGGFVDQMVLEFYSPGTGNPRSSYNPNYGDLYLTGDAVNALPGQPGNWLWQVSGEGIAKVVLDFGEGFDPNIGFDLMDYTICQPTSGSETAWAEWDVEWEKRWGGYFVQELTPPGGTTTLDPADGVNFFNVELFDISGSIFRDEDNDGVWDDGEGVIPGVPVTLTGSWRDGTPISAITVHADGNGDYIFPYLPPGDYTLTVPSDWTDDTGRYFDLTTDMSILVTLRDGDSGDNDFGFVPYYDISGYAWQDDNMNGVWDYGELGLENVVVTLRDGGGNYMYAVVTDATGYYLFDDELPGDYQVTVEDTHTDEGGRNYMLTSDDTLYVTLGPDSEDNNFGYVPLYDIFGTVFLDANMNGAFNVDEPVFPDVTVYLTGTDLDEGTWELTATTDADGNYVFEDLPPGTYTMTVPLETADVEDDLNEMLVEYFDPTTLRPITVTLGPDAAWNNFGYAVDTTTLIIELPEYDGTGKTIGFWKHQFQAHLRESKKVRAHVDAETLQGYVDDIEEFYLSEPFQFEGNEFQAAFDVMKSTSSDPVDLLKKQLLASELNYMSGWGIDDDMVLMGFLVMWGEYVVANYEEFNPDDVIEAKDIFDYINNSGE